MNDPILPTDDTPQTAPQAQPQEDRLARLEAAMVQLGQTVQDAAQHATAIQPPMAPQKAPDQYLNDLAADPQGPAVLQPGQRNQGSVLGTRAEDGSVQEIPPTSGSPRRPDEPEQLRHGPASVRINGSDQANAESLGSVCVENSGDCGQGIGTSVAVEKGTPL